MSREKKPSPADILSQKLMDDVRTSMRESSVDEKTVALSREEPFDQKSRAGTFTRAANDETIAVDGFQSRKRGAEVPAQVAVGAPRRSSGGQSMAASTVEAHLLQSENLRLAQQKILELEKEIDRLRKENDELFSAGQFIKDKSETWQSQVLGLEQEKRELKETLQSEILILKGQIQYKDNQVRETRTKNEELEARLKTDFRKIRVRERELENRLELSIAEKAALVRAKDESILDLKRKLDQTGLEVESYRLKIQELNRTLEVNQDQFKKTVRALRLALAQLEVKDETLSSLKKAE